VVTSRARTVPTYPLLAFIELFSLVKRFSIVCLIVNFVVAKFMVSTTAPTSSDSAAASNATTETKETNGKAATTTTSFYDDSANLKKLCDFLRGRNGPPVREALLIEKRVHYLKGS
jgi:hypothetical protein